MKKSQTLFIRRAAAVRLSVAYTGVFAKTFAALSIKILSDYEADGRILTLA